MRVAALALLVLAGCSHAQTPVTVVPEPYEMIPVRWIDLPEAPFIAKVKDGKALLVARGKEAFTAVGLGCVSEQQGRTHVIATLTAMNINDGHYGPGFPVERLLATINDAEAYERSGGPKNCPADAHFAVVRASQEPNSKPTWSAEGTPWPRR